MVIFVFSVFLLWIKGIWWMIDFSNVDFLILFGLIRVIVFWWWIFKLIGLDKVILLYLIVVFLICKIIFLEGFFILKRKFVCFLFFWGWFRCFIFFNVFLWFCVCLVVEVWIRFWVMKFFNLWIFVCCFL